MVIIGLASVIIGEVIFGVSSLLRRLLAVVLGAMVYRFVIALAMEAGMPPTDMKLILGISGDGGAFNAGYSRLSGGKAEALSSQARWGRGQH